MYPYLVHHNTPVYTTASGLGKFFAFKLSCTKDGTPYFLSFTDHTDYPVLRVTTQVNDAALLLFRAMSKNSYLIEPFTHQKRWLVYGYPHNGSETQVYIGDQMEFSNVRWELSLVSTANGDTTTSTDYEVSDNED